MRVVFDADILAYSCGFAVEKSVYDWIDTEGNQGICQLPEEVPDGASFNKIKEAEPLSHALALVKKTVEGVEFAIRERGHTSVSMQLYLTGKGNYREGIATIRGYKANRMDMEKPIHYQAIREFMVKRYKAIVVEGYEADDAVTMEACRLGFDPTQVIIVSADKDLMTVPGLLYNLQRKMWYEVSEKDALVNFYKQVLTGDKVDNIVGVYRCGEIRANELIKSYMTEHAMYKACLDEYKVSQRNPKCPYLNLSPEDALLENARLLHMRRYEGEMWLPPLQRTGQDTSGVLPPASPSKVSVSGTRRTGSVSMSQKQAVSVQDAESLKLNVDLPTNQTSSSVKKRTSKPRVNSPQPTESV